MNDKNKKIFCDICKRKIKFNSNTIKSTNVTIDGKKFDVQYFTCRNCKKIYIVSLLDDNVKYYQKILQDAISEINANALYSESKYNSYEEYEENYNNLLSKYEMAKINLHKVSNATKTHYENKVIACLQNKLK